MYLNTKKENSDTSLHLGETADRDCYSIMLLAATVSRQEWLAEEYLGGRINEKEFLRTLLIETSSQAIRAKIRYDHE